jgi:hypothetical protein
MKITEDKYIEILEIQGISYNKNSKWFTVSLERINEAINYTRCSTQLKTENKKLSYDEWKERLNVQKVEETIYKKGEHFMTINDILEMYNEYCSSF